jgi:hypothetical protein
MSGKREGVPHNGVMYIAPSIVNGAEHGRWINRNWEAIAADLERFKTDGNAYYIALPQPEKWKDFNFIVWFIFDEFAELHARTMATGEVPVMKQDGKECQFDKIYTVNGDDTTAFTLVNKRVLDDMLSEKKRKFDQEKMLMNLNEINLILWPLQGEAGWQAYAEMASELEKRPGALGERVQFTAEVSVVFEPFRQALPRKEASGPLSLPMYSKVNNFNSYNQARVDQMTAQMRALGQ